MFKALGLIFSPEKTWTNIANAQRSLGYVLALQLVPMILLGVAVEAWGIYHWGKWRPDFHKFHQFSLNVVIAYGVVKGFFYLVAAFLAAYLIQNMSQTFDRRYSFVRVMTMVAYSMSPFFLINMLNAAPSVNPFAPWILGVAMTIWLLYQGIPRVIQPDQPHAFGLYLSACIVLFLTTGVVCVLTAMFLLGKIRLENSWLIRTFPGLAQ